MKPSRTIATVLLACLTPTATGCYRFAPVTPEEPPPEMGSQVQVHLNQPERVRLLNVTAEGVVQINGELATWDDGEVVLSAFWVRTVSGFEYRAEGETVVVENSNIRSLTAKRINVPLTVGLTAAGVAGVVVIGAAFATNGGSGDEGGDGGGNVSSRRGPRF